jgi:hypothetical protein
MIIRYEIRTLESLPWPHGLGKFEYRRLERRMEALLGVGYLKPAAHQRAFETNAEYRGAVFEELQATRWSQHVVAVAEATTALAQTAPLLGANLTNDEPWRIWARAQPAANPFVRSWLISPPDMTGGFLNARHRITYLRLVRAPSFSVLVMSQR